MQSCSYYTFLLGDRLILLSDVCFQCSNTARVALVDVALKELPEEESCWVGGQVRRVRYPFHFSFAAYETLPKLFTEPYHGNMSRVRKSTILLEPQFLLIRCSCSASSPRLRGCCFVSTIVKHTLFNDFVWMNKKDWLVIWRLMEKTFISWNILLACKNYFGDNNTFLI